MAEGVAAERVTGKEQDVGEHEHTAETYAETSDEIEGQDRVEPEKSHLDHRRVKGKSVEVVEHPWKGGLASVAAVGFRHRAGPRVPEERAEVRLAVVIAGEAKCERRPCDPDAGRDRPDPDQRRVEGTEVRRVITLVLKEHHPDGERPEKAEGDDHERGRGPNGQGAVRVSEDCGARGGGAGRPDVRS